MVSVLFPMPAAPTQRSPGPATCGGNPSSGAGRGRDEPAAGALVGQSMGGLVVQRHLERASAPAAVLLAPGAGRRRG
jgi:hypothetical protein